MDIRKIRKPLSEFVKAIPEDIQVDEVIVFGSYSNGEATQDSDIDVVVISDSFKKMGEDDRLDTLSKAAIEVMDINLNYPPIEPWGFTKEEMEKARPASALGDIWRKRGAIQRVGGTKNGAVSRLPVSWVNEFNEWLRFSSDPDFTIIK